MREKFDAETEKLLKTGEVIYNGDDESLNEDFELSHHEYKVSDDVIVINGEKCREIIFDA